MNELVERLAILRDGAERDDRCGDECAYRDAIKALEAADAMADVLALIDPSSGKQFLAKEALTAYRAATKKG